MAMPLVLRICLVVGIFVLALATAERLPIHVPTDGAKWFGNDGNWSTVTVRLGTPAQYVYLTAGTSSSITTTVDTPWCKNFTSGYTCEKRGRDFNFRESSSWKNSGTFNIDIRQELRDTNYMYTVQDYGYANYGRDKMKIKLVDNSLVELDNRVIGALNETTQLIGSLGLGVESTSFTKEEAYPSLMSSLYDNGTIPSRSYGYTAGNYYRTERVPMDLVLGGKNLGRYSENNVSFDLDANKNPVMTLDDLQISATGNPPWGAGSKSLLPQPVLAQIDSSTPYMWLPEEACRRFEESLGITWNTTNNLYLLNDTLVQDITRLNVSFSFTLAKQPGSTEKVDIVVPYSAMNLQTSWPFINTTSFANYFPLKRAKQDQITIGRTFLQEAYLIIDYERENFSVHQTLNPVGVDNIETIYHPNKLPTTSNKKTKKGLSTGAIVGIAVGGAVILLAITAIIFCCSCKRKPVNNTEFNPETDTGAVNGAWEIWTPWGNSNKANPASEAGTNIPVEMPCADAPNRVELAAVNQNPVELDGSFMRHEAPSIPPSRVPTPSTMVPNTPTTVPSAPSEGWSPMSPMAPSHEKPPTRFNIE